MNETNSSKSALNVIVFACNWDGLSCVEAAGQNGLSYPASVKVVRVSCLSRINAGLILRAFELGADGVMLLGCEPGNCHFSAGEGIIAQQYEKARDVLKLLGYEDNRLALVQLPPGQGYELVKSINSFVTEIENIIIKA